ncbi:MAG: TrkH family potassium uptake protein [Thermoleophilia bacterium]|nr:TrkH family potassium uptake protein [Thermoleophilia bacterium]
MMRALLPGRLGVDVGSALDLVGGVLKYLSLAFVVPAGIALAYREPFWPFLAAGGLSAATGWALDRATGSKTGELVRPREGFLVVALTWLVVPAFGALPYLFAGAPGLGNPVDAYFESVSGFTATGATVLTDIEALGRALAMWRQFTQWLGGMGIIVLAVAVLPRLRVGGRQLLQSELAGPTELERLTSTIRDTARRLWLLYVGLTGAAAGLLALFAVTGADPAMTVFDAVAHAFTAIAIGGFSTRSDSIAAFGPATQWAILVFFVLAGINFLRLYRLLVMRRARAVAGDEEFRLYAAFLLAGSLVLLTELLASGAASGEEAVRHAAFQAASIMTTTGFATADYTQWSALAELTLLLLMFVGASAGSTGGSMKVIRHLLLAKLAQRELRQAVHPDAVIPIRVSGAVVDERALRSAAVFVVLYIAVFALGATALVIDARRTASEIAAFEAIGAAAACLGNVGPAFGFAGPFGSYEGFSDLSTGILTSLMWLGRLEIIPVVVLFMRGYWRA